MIPMRIISDLIGLTLNIGSLTTLLTMGMPHRFTGPKRMPLYLTASWMKENVTDRGPFGELYSVWSEGKQMVEGDKVDYFGFFWILG